MGIAWEGHRHFQEWRGLDSLQGAVQNSTFLNLFLTNGLAGALPKTPLYGNTDAYTGGATYVAPLADAAATQAVLGAVLGASAKLGVALIAEGGAKCP